MEKRVFKRKALADATGLSSETIRFYEQKGLLTPQRDSNGYRLYSEQDLQRINFINHAKGLGFSLTEVKGLLDISPTDKEQARSKVDLKIAELTTKIDELSAMRSLLQKLSDTCVRSCVTDHLECPILEYMNEVDTYKE